MKNLKDYIDSGLLEMYVMGMASDEESTEVQEMSTRYAEVRLELERIEESMLAYAEQHAIQPPSTIKPLLLASVDYMERLGQGEPVSFPPQLRAGSKIEDYAFWLNDKNAKVPPDFDNIYARIIGYTPLVATAIIWIKEYTPPEMHTNQHEKFLVVQGSCDIFIGQNVHHLAPGDMLSIPLHISHHIKITSSETCVVILERSAA